MSKPTQFLVITDKDELVATITAMKEKAERGELECTTMRVFNADGTWKDVVLGGTEEERAKALADLQAAQKRLH